MVAWYERDEHRARLVAEHDAMAERFPQFQLRRENGRLYWEGNLLSNQGRTYTLKVCYPDGFPQDFPKVYVTAPRLKPNGHTWARYDPSSFLCLFRPESGAHRHSYDPARTTAASIVGWAAHWLACYEVFENEGWWPGSSIHTQSGAKK